MIVEQLPRKMSKIASHVGLNKLGLKVTWWQIGQYRTTAK